MFPVPASATARHNRNAVSLGFATAFLFTWSSLAGAAHPGAWSPAQPTQSTTNFQQVHMMLLPGDGTTHHSRILAWGEMAGGALRGDELGWNPGTAGCNDAPYDALPVLGSWSPLNDVYCSGHAGLPDGGGVLVVGGHSSGWGMPDASTFTVGAGASPGAWTTRPAMHQARFYPTITSLRDGRLVVTGGHRDHQTWYFGGRVDGDPPAGETGHYLHRLSRGTTKAIWDLPVTPLTTVQDERPGPREGHTTVRLPELDAQVYFGGRDGSGNVVDNETWLLRRDPYPQGLAADYSYRWEKLLLASGSPMPQPRSEHIAIGVSATEMIIFGGAQGGTEELYRLFKNVDEWTWGTVSASGTGPTARYGHTAVFQDGGSPRMIVFGGSDTLGGTPTNARVWAFNFGSGFGSGTWSEISVGSGSVPLPRRDHAMVLAGTDLLVYGGYSTTTISSDTLWKLNLSGTPTWTAIATGGPGPRAHHTMHYDADKLGARLGIFGGERPRPEDPAVDSRAYFIDPLAATPTWVQGQPATYRLSGHTVGFDTHGLLHAHLAEIYDPASPGWVRQANSGWFPPSTYFSDYSVQFLVPGTSSPGGGGRLLRVGPDPIARYLDIPATGQAGSWQTVPANNGTFHPQTGVQYMPGKILVAANAVEPTATARTFDATQITTATWIDQPGMLARKDPNMVVMPDGTVLILGGTCLCNGGFETPELCPQIWDPNAPAGDRWTEGTPCALTLEPVSRGYHSTAMLLPDARVLTGGGSALHELRVFCPPYLYESGSTLAVRPEIQNAPTEASWGRTFTVCVADTTGIRKASLIRPAAVTHSFDQNQRYVPLTIEGHAGNPQRLFVTAPASPDSAPPGDYLLFLVGAGSNPDVPAIARWMRLRAPDGSDLCDVVPPATTTLAPDVVGPTSVFLTWSAPADDGVIAASGRARRFDLRKSTEPISDEPGWSFAGPVSGVPEPGAVGSGQGLEVTGLFSCTDYYFSLRAEDDRPNLAALPTHLHVQTTCDGGGGGLSAQQAGGEEEVDAVSAGATAEVSSAAVCDRETTTGTLVVTTAPLNDGGWQVGLRLLAAEPVAASSTTGVTVEQDDVSGARDTLGRFEPGEADHLLGICALRERGRIGVPGVYQLEQVLPRIRSRDGDLALADAWHSRFGSLGSGFTSSGGPVEFTEGDSLALTYVPAASPQVDASAWYLLVRRSGDEPITPMSRHLVPGERPQRFALHRAEPNPAGSRVLIRFDLPVASPVRLEVFDLLGRRVARLAHGDHGGGEHAVTWDLRDAVGAVVRPGIYAVRLTAGQFTARQKVAVRP